MYKIVDKEFFSENVVKLEVEAPLIAKARQLCDCACRRKRRAHTADHRLSR